MKLYFSTVLQKSCICFSNFQTEDKYTKLYNILYCRSACGNPSHGNNCKVPYRYALYPAKSGCNGKQPLHGQEECLTALHTAMNLSDCDTINIPGTCRYFTGMVIHISGKHGIVGGKPFHQSKYGICAPILRKTILAQGTSLRYFRISRSMSSAIFPLWTWRDGTGASVSESTVSARNVIKS